MSWQIKGGMIVNILFDVDDTLYDQMLPFKDAYTEVFGEQYGMLYEKVYVASRKYSDEVFELSQSGQITMEEMYIYRIQKAFEELKVGITDTQALDFQHRYSHHQKHITLSETMKELLTFCSEQQITIGIITNGPSGHQWNKVEALGVMEWIPQKHIFVSEDIGFSKPDPRIFNYVKEFMNLQSNRTYFIGDSFNNDILGAKQANLKAIWFNRREHNMPENVIKPDYCVTDEAELFEWIIQLVDRVG